MSLFKRLSQEEKDFNETFDQEVKEVMVLTEDNMGAGKSGNNQMWTVNISILAYIDLETGELVEGKKVLQWLVNDEQCHSREKIFNLQKETMYKLKVRESLPFTNEFTHQLMERGRWLMVVDVVERDCQESRLNDILKEYQKEVIIQPYGCEELQLDKSLGLFSGFGEWNGTECDISLESDEAQETANEAVATLEKLLKDCPSWDQKARQYASEHLTDLANDWAEEEDSEITQEDFKQRLEICEVSVSTEGRFELYYNDDDMFLGHVIIVSGHIEKGFDDAYIAG